MLPTDSSLTNLILIVVVAILNAYTAWATLQARKVINQLEKNTNSMKDALVAMTAKTSFREGSDAGLATAAAATVAAAKAAAIEKSEEPVKVDVVKLPP